MGEEIVLINPPFSRERGYRFSVAPLGTKAQPPLGLAYLAAVLEREGFSIKIVDAIAQDLNIEELRQKLNFLRPKIVGVTATTPMFSSASKVISMVKESLPATFTIMGGPHVTALPEEVLLNSPEIDFVVIGEGEFSFLELVRAIFERKDTSQIQGIAYRKNGGVLKNPLRAYIENLDSLPFPARHLLPMNLYRPSPVNYRRAPATSIISSRGCPLGCIFCTKGIFGQRLRLRSPENVVQEVKILKERFGIKEIHFYDDTFTINKTWVKEICELLKDMKVWWWCNGRVDDVDKEILSLMRNAGCYRIYYGVESMHKKSLELLKKKTRVEDLLRSFKLTRDSGIEAAAFMLIGIPGETFGDIRESIDFVKKLKADHAVFSVLTPYPGTELFCKLQDYGRMRIKNWDDFVMISEAPVFLAHSITELELKQALNIAYRQLVFSPRFIFNKIKEVFYSPSKFFLYLRGLFFYFKRNLLT